MVTSHQSRGHRGEVVSAGERDEQHALLRESAQRFCALDVHVPRSRRLRGTALGYEREVWGQIADMGWLGILLPEQAGGLGLSVAEMAVVCEAAGRALLPEPIAAAAVLASGCVLYGDNEALKQTLLPSFADGRLLPALAWREQGHEHNLLAVNATACRDRGGVRLSGNKRLVVGGAGADGFVVSARVAEGVALYWVPAQLAVSGITRIELADGRAAVELCLDGIHIPDDHQVAMSAAAEAALLRAYDETLIMQAAELLGVLSRTFEITLAYLRTREQFGKLIGSYQALQHRAVDLYAAQFMSRCTLNEVLDQVTSARLSPAQRGALASRVKARCAEASLRVTREAIQMHGAMGFSDECDVGLYLKRALTLSAWLGGPDVQRLRYAQLAPREEEAEV